MAKWLETQGVEQTPEGLHDDFAITVQMAAVDPNSVRAEERIKAGRFRINGVDLAPVGKTAAWGRKIADYRAEATIAALRRARQRRSDRRRCGGPFRMAPGFRSSALTNGTTW